MRTSIYVAAVCLVVMPPVAWAGAGAEPAAPSAADEIAVEGLIRSARQLTIAPPDTPGRAGRLVAITRFAERLHPAQAETQWLLANIYESQGKVAQAAEA